MCRSGKCTTNKTELFKSCPILQKYKKEAQGFLFIFGTSCFIGFKQKVSNTNGFLREDLCVFLNNKLF